MAWHLIKPETYSYLAILHRGFIACGWERLRKSVYLPMTGPIISCVIRQISALVVRTKQLCTRQIWADGTLLSLRRNHCRNS